MVGRKADGKKYKTYGFSGKPEILDPILKEIDRLAIEQHTSRSYVISNIILDYFGVSADVNCNYKKTLDCSEILKESLNKAWKEEES
jgi:hypothetical protein